MKIEKLSKNNINDFIDNIGISDSEFICNLENDINKKELFGIMEDGIYYLGFESQMDIDAISILFYSNKLSDDKFYECIDFLNNSLVVDSHLIILVFEDKYMKLMDDKYKCREILVTYGNRNDNNEIDTNIKEKYAELEMKSIKYFGSNDMVTCNLVRQNITDESLILDLHNYFKSSGVNIINFFIFSDSYNYIKSLGYECVSKSYVINSLF